MVDAPLPGRLPVVVAGEVERVREVAGVVRELPHEVARPHLVTGAERTHQAPGHLRDLPRQEAGVLDVTVAVPGAQLALVARDGGRIGPVEIGVEEVRDAFGAPALVAPSSIPCASLYVVPV
jgi:hypothetical protein